MVTLNSFIYLYKGLWKISREKAEKARENTRIKSNRETYLVETARKQIFTDFLDQLTILKQEYEALNNIILEQKDHINSISAERDKYKTFFETALQNQNGNGTQQKETIKLP